jgi:hypothetical protein
MRDMPGKEAEPIDAVYTWVDGSAPGFPEALARAATETAADASATARSRFTDNEELRFSLRALHRYAPWIGRVFIVTNGQVPAWLDPRNDRVSIVHHRDIFARSADLPTFNSLAIELQLHRIPGLSRRFLYFNDDVMFGRPVSPARFCAPAGGQRFFSESRLITRAGDGLIESAAMASLEAVERVLGGAPSPRWPAHAPLWLDREVLAEIESAFEPEVRATTASRLRQPGNLWLALVYRGLLMAREPGRHEEVVLREPSPDYRFLRLDGSWWWWARSFFEMSLRMPELLCINDDLGEGPSSSLARAALAGFYRHVLPDPSPFERPAG